MKPYPKYSDSGIQWLGKMPSHWQTEKLKYLAKVNNSNVDKKTIEGELPVRLCNYTDVYYSNYIHPGLSFMNATATKDELKKFRLHEGDILITKDSESWDDIAIPAYVIESSEDMVCGYHLSHIHPETERIAGKYLFYSFMSDDIRVQFEISATGITRYGVPKYSIDNGLFLLPPIPEQKQIAKYLDHKTAQIDSLIEKKKRLIELLKEERTAVINQAVTKGLNPNVPMKDSGIEWLGEIPSHWKVKRLKYEAKVNRETLPETTKPDYEIEYIDIGNVTLGKIVDSPKLLTFENAPSRARRVVKKGDTILSTVRTYLKAITYIDMEKDNLIASTGFAVITPGNNLNPKYLSYLMTSEKIIDTICSLSTGVSYPAVNSTDVGNLFIWYPQLNEQDSIVKYIEKETAHIDSILSETEKEIELLQEYRTALISEVVTGKIDVREEKI